ncbi:MAG: ArsR family transcriptional regulator [Planctomycetes bacterium]|nr:ArsR family transcriptional regulator [Planctomycetota bacterium]MCC7508764.1 ArsR family transcriptional regulator [Planctomycetota bacterium]
MDEVLRDHLTMFETFFNAIGFKSRLGRVWGMLALSGKPMSAAEITAELDMSAGSVSECLNELREWGAATAEFSSEHRCQMHSAVSDTMSIVTTVLRRREALAVQNFKDNARSALRHVTESYGEKDPRAKTLQSIVTTSEIAEATIQFFVAASSAVPSDQDSRLSRVIRRMTAIGMKVPGELSKMRNNRRKTSPVKEDAHV